MALSGVDTGLVVGQFITGVVDGSDLDDEPDLIGARGTFEFTPAASYVPVPMASPNGFTLLRETFVAILDSEGHLCTPDPDFPSKPGIRGIRLFATDSPNASVDNWTWHVTPKFVNAAGMPIPSYIPPFDIYVLRDKVTDLANAIKVPNSTGVGKEQIVAYATSAQEAATYAARQAEYAAEEASSAGISAWEATDIAQQAMAVSALAEKVAQGVQKQAEDGEFVPDITVKVNTVANPADDVWMSDIIRESPLVSATLREVFPTSMQGVKGDRGGWDNGTDLGTSDLNDITQPGLYKAGVSANVTLERHYPIAGAQGTGVLEVMWQGGTASQSRLQRYTIVWGASTGKVVFVRTLTSSSWGPWNALNSQRIDNTAGRAIYTWDHTAGREQLTYGDTGWRDITKLAPEVTAGIIYYRRNLYQCTVIFQSVLLDAPLGSNVSLTIPNSSATLTGFMPLLSGMTSSHQFHLFQYDWAGNHKIMKRIESGFHSQLTWPTYSSWPTTLPGVAAPGVVPNS